MVKACGRAASRGHDTLHGVSIALRVKAALSGAANIHFGAYV